MTGLPLTSFTLFLADESQTLECGRQFANACQPLLMEGYMILIFLQGQLGAGKTTFSRGFLQQLGVTGKIKSPTYTLIEPYKVQGGGVYHFDFYRIKDPEELFFMGLDDYFTPPSISLIEWPECGTGWLPDQDISCYIELTGSSRQFNAVAHSEVGARILQRLI